MSGTKTILVTGGSGLVGSAIRYVIEHEPVNSRFGKRDGEEWVFLSSKDGDLRDKKQVDGLMDKHKPDAVIHLAALVGGLFANMARKVDFLRDNLLMNDAVLQSSHEHDVTKVVSCLSTCVFPDKVEYPLTEKKIHDGPPHHSNAGYAIAKRLVDTQNEAYFAQFGRRYTSVIPTNVFGPHDNFDLEQAHVIPALIHKCYLAKQNATPFYIAGTGSPLRQFIYSRDLAKLFIWTLREYDEISPIILSVGENEEISIKEVAESIIKEVGFTGDHGFDTTKADGQHRKPASNDKLMGYLPDFKFTPFPEAMHETVSWFLKEYNGQARIGNVQQKA